MTDLVLVVLSISLAVLTRESWRSWRLKRIEASSRAYWTNQ